MPRGRHHRRVVEDEYSSSSDSDSRYGNPIVINNRNERPRDHRRASDRPIIINQRLGVPESGGRHRSNSQGGQPNPVILQVERSPSRHRHRHSSSSSRSRSRHSRRPSSYRDERDLPYELRKKLDLADELEQRRQRDRLWEEEKLKLARDRDEQDRKDRERRERMLREVEDEKRKENDRKAAYLHEQEDREREAKRQRDELARKLKDEEAKDRAEQEETRKRILAEAEAKKKKDEEAAKELKAKILREAKEEEEREKAKKKQAEIDFENRVRERAQKAGWSEDYIEDLLNTEKDKHKHDHHHGHRSPSPRDPYHDRQLLLDYQKPSKWIRVKRIHVLPETLEFYHLPWEYDEEDDEYIMIKQYISHDLQRDLFAHTKNIMQTRRLIAPGYEKETIVTLKPRDERVIKKKKNGEMYIVRKKSVSPAPRRLSFLG